MQDVAEASIPASAGGIDRLGGLALVRIAVEVRGVARGVIAADLAILASPRRPALQWRAAVERAIEALISAGFVAGTSAGLEATEAGVAAAAKFLGVADDLPSSWEQTCSVWLIAKALGWQRAPAKRLAGLETAEGLRAAVLTHAYGLQVKGVATPARLRRALAATALRGAFGEDTAAGLARKLGLSARASRLLAAQLLSRPRDLGTDRRLVAALAAQSVGATTTELGALRLAVLRRFLSTPEEPARAKRERRRLSAKDDAAPGPSSVQETLCASAALPAPAVPTALPPDLAGFAREVRSLAANAAQGWSGDRKAYISHVWRNIRERRPEWGLSEVEFKDLLAEAHRSGQLALANADLKDESNIKDVQDSAVSYRNAVFHFIRVDA